MISVFRFLRRSCDTVDNMVIPVLIWISTVLTVVSGAVYLKGYWHLIDSDK